MIADNKEDFAEESVSDSSEKAQEGDQMEGRIPPDEGDDTQPEATDIKRKMTDVSEEEAEPAQVKTDPIEVDDGASGDKGELEDQLLRALAELENVRKRAIRERDDAAKYGITNFARDIVGVADNLRRALESVDEAADKSQEIMEGLRSGIAIIQQEFDTVLTRHGVEVIEPMGQMFDHNFHQAMFEVAQDDKPGGTVVQVLQQGYKIHDRLLRPAMVGVVKKGPGDKGSEAENGH